MDYAFGILEPNKYFEEVSEIEADVWEGIIDQDNRFILTDEPKSYNVGELPIISYEEVDDYLKLVDNSGLFISGNPISLASVDVVGDMPDEKVYDELSLNAYSDYFDIETGDFLEVFGLKDYDVGFSSEYGR